MICSFWFHDWGKWEVTKVKYNDFGLVPGISEVKEFEKLIQRRVCNRCGRTIYEDVN